jgi:hypothetical protein
VWPNRKAQPQYLANILIIYRPLFSKATSIVFLLSSGVSIIATVLVVVALVTWVAEDNAA